MGMRRGAFILGTFLLLLLIWSDPAVAQRSFARGVTNLVVGPLQIPMGLLAGTAQGPLLLGTVAGTLMGTFRALTQTLSGALELSVVLAPLAKYLPLVL